MDGGKIVIAIDKKQINRRVPFLDSLMTEFLNPSGAAATEPYDGRMSGTLESI